MIYESIQKAYEDLDSQWHAFSDAATQLVTLTQPSGVGFSYPMTPPFQIWLSVAAAIIEELDQHQTAVNAYPNISAMLHESSASFHRSLDSISQIDAAAGPSSALAQLKGSPIGAVSATANLIASLISDLVAANQKYVQDVDEIIAPESLNLSTAGINNTVSDISTYPVFTQEVSFGGGSGGNGGGSTARNWQGPGSSGLGSFIQRSIGDVLGRTPRAADPKSFVAALNASFVSRSFEGRTVVEFSPRGYLGSTELGGTVTGAQASLYMRAKSALDEALPLLDRIEPLRPNADPQELDAARAIVRDEFRELVDEMGNEGGPRLQRADDLFALLILNDFNALDNGLSITAPANTQLLADFGMGELGRLGDVFGLTRDRVNTLSEEQNQTNFRVLRDYLTSLYQSWQGFRAILASGTNNFLGTQLVRLSRTLSVINESVDEVSYAMNSVFLGPSERKTTRIDFPSAPPLMVDELLTWISSFVSTEGPRLIQDGGKQGVRRVVPTLQRLSGLVNSSDGRIRHPGAKHPRVRKTLEELRNQLNDAAQLAATV